MTAPLRPDTKKLPTASRYALAVLVLLLCWLLVMAGLRAHLVDAAFAPYVGCQGCFYWPTLAHDLSLLALGMALAGGALLVRSPWLRLLPMALLGLLMVAMAADLLVFHSLTHRLLWSDVLKFARELSAVSDVGARSLHGSARLLAATLATAALLIWLSALRVLKARPRLGLLSLGAALAVALAAWSSRGLDPDYVNANLSFQNLLEVNLAQSIDAPYSEAFIERMRSLPALPQRCTPGQARRPNVILVMVESLSAYQSRRYGGELDALPQLDALAAGGRWFPDFHANGFTTDGGMIALLTGQAPIPVFGRYASMDAFAGYADRAHSVPALLAEHGYASVFFTTGDLGFVDKNRWLPEIGFDRFEGAESGYYEGKARGIFGAARDSLLFDRFAQWYDHERDTGRPFFAALLTVTTHPPFINPETGTADETAVLREVDSAIAGLHGHLQASGFFEHGILLVTGDHRAMTPLHRAEYQRHGESAYSRVPMYFWGPSDFSPGRIDGVFQHSDLLPSLADLTGSEACHGPGQGLMLRPAPQAASFALHARGMPRDRIDVIGSDFQGAVILAGDRSHWTGDQPGNWQSIEAAIHLQRASRASGSGNLLERLIELRAPAP
jgi:lipoteichoic acid synthase